MSTPGDLESDVVMVAVDPPPPPAVPPALNTLQTVSLLVIATILLAVSLSYTRSMMIPFAFAVFLSYFVAPLVGFLRKRARFPHWLAVTSSLLSVLCLCTLFLLVLRGSILRLIASFYLYEERLSQVSQVVTEFFGRFGISLSHDALLARIRDLPVFTYVQSAAGFTLEFVAEFLLVMVFLTFLISGKTVGERPQGLAGQIDRKIRAYILTKVISSLAGAFCVWLVYVSVGLDLSLMFAMLAFVLGFIPSVGSIIAVALPLPIAYLQYENTWPFWVVILGPALIQSVIGNLVEPKFLGRGLDLHPVTILLSLMFWGIIWGVAGTFLAVPITAVLKIILDRHPLTRNFSEVLAGRSPI